MSLGVKRRIVEFQEPNSTLWTYNELRPQSGVPMLRPQAAAIQLAKTATEG